MIPKPRFLQKRISEVEIGTFRQIATVQETASVYDALTIFVERRVSALPVVNEQGTLNITLTFGGFLLDTHYRIMGQILGQIFPSL